MSAATPSVHALSICLWLFLLLFAVVVTENKKNVSVGTKKKVVNGGVEGGV